ncbi:glycosyltransferase family 4 protein [bacterium]|nr:glycosyltransferase family 4 protein [bacterium]
MRIAQVAPLWIPVPPYNYGGTELIVSWLTEELVRRGHEVTLFASGDSKTSARLIPIWHKSLWRAHLRTPHAVYSLLYKKILEMQDEFDIIHDHCEFYTAHLSDLLKPPVISTIHHPIYEEMIVLFKKFPKINYVTISKNQKRSAPGINIVKTIYHGLPIEQYPFNPQPKNYLLWLSKITPEKGPAEAIEIAKEAGENLIIAGPILPGFSDYFEYRIKPLIDGKQIQFVGVADFQKKVELFSNAKGFLYPIKRQEPFGLVVIEAMICGTPVVAYNQGSMPEIVKDKKTGFLVSSKEEAVEAVKKINEIKRIDCRRHVLKKFNLKKMVNKYEALYYKILKKQRDEKR